jgi:hypothetical protein
MLRYYMRLDYQVIHTVTVFVIIYNIDRVCNFNANIE